MQRQCRAASEGPFAAAARAAPDRRHRRRWAAIAGEHGRDPQRKAPVAVEAALHFEEQRHAPGNEIAEFAERDQALGAAAEGDAFERRRGNLVEPVGAFSQPTEFGVMVDDGLAVGADLQVGLDAVLATSAARTAPAVFSITPLAASCSPR